MTAIVRRGHPAECLSQVKGRIKGRLAAGANESPVVPAEHAAPLQGAQPVGDIGFVIRSLLSSSVPKDGLWQACGGFGPASTRMMPAVHRTHGYLPACDR